MSGIIAELLAKDEIQPFILVGIHANEERVQEYGTASQPDYANRGSKAGLTTAFVLDELLPYLFQQYSVDRENFSYAGFSLGGLMALDIVWSHPDIFTKAAVFSGALWWRKKALDQGYSDCDRIMHAQIKEGTYEPGLKFWFQTGGLDETDDRDGDGVIDSIQDTLECISELEQKGYKWGTDIGYLEIPDGYHDVPTWGRAMPVFLKWAFPLENYKEEISTIW